MSGKPLRVLGIGALVGGGLAILLTVFAAALLVGPLVFWIAWNVLDFAQAIGLPELGFWPIVLATLFLIVGWFGKSIITAIVFLVHPAWLDGAAQVNWPEPKFTTFLAIVLLSILASRPHAHAHKRATKKPAPKETPTAGPWTTIAGEIRTAIASAAENKRETTQQ